MISFCLPNFDIKLSHNQGRPQIFDFLRRRYVALTPEEWVRQRFTHHLVENLGYPASLLANEVMVRINGVARRCDTVLYHREGGFPRMIVEYKAPDIPITQRVFDQIASYNSVLRADYLMLSNGMQHFCCHINYAENKAEPLDYILPYGELMP